jgi:hypothetical protein
MNMQAHASQGPTQPVKCFADSIAALVAIVCLLRQVAVLVSIDSFANEDSLRKAEDT